MSAAFRQLVMAASAAALLTVALTWPLTARLASAGRVDSGDGRHGVWNVAWVARALTTDVRTLWDANIFHPHPDALAFAEANIVAGVLAVPMWLATHNALAATNSVILLSFVLSAVATFALVRHLTGSVAAASLGALFFAFAPNLFSRLPHMQLLMTFGLPLSLLAFHRFVEAPGPKRATALGAALALTALACGYFGIFAGLMVGWGVVWFAVAHGHWRVWRYWIWAVAAIVVAALITAPFLAPYADIQTDGFARSLNDARIHSADWRSYLTSPMLLHRWMLPLIGTWGEVLFPGVLAVVFAAATIVLTIHSAARGAPRWPLSVVGFYASLVVLAAWASFGPDAGLYWLFFHTLPFFELIRASARFGILVTLGCSVLAAFSLSHLLSRLAGWRRHVTLAAVATAALALAVVGPLPLHDQPEPHEVYQRLAQMPRGAVAEFPYYTSAADRHRHTEYMLASTWHWQPLINGYSDHTPPEAFADGLVLATFPNAEVWDVLRRRGTRYVVVHWLHLAGSQHVRNVLFDRDVGDTLRVVVDDDDASLFEIIAPLD